jgi:sulfopyruvate decarboxylase subunit alpha
MDGAAIANTIRELGVTHVVCVPDTNLKTVIAALEGPGMPKMLYPCTEDEAMGINAGLYITGHRPMLLIQNNGLLACLNTLKAIALDAQVPTLMLIGQYGRDVGKPVEQNSVRAVSLLEPTLATWSVPSFRMDRPEDLGTLAAAWERAWSNKGPAAAVVGAISC